MKNIQIILSKAVDILRDRYSRRESIDCLLKLLLLKRLSDLSERYQEESDVLITKQFIFYIPESFRWSLIQEDRDIRSSLQEAASKIEEKVPALEGLLSNRETKYWDKFSEDILRNLFDLFSKLDLSDGSLDFAEEISLTFEVLFSSYFLEISSIYTPKSISDMLMKIISPQLGCHIYDPECGAGEMLSSAFRHIYKETQSTSYIHLYGESSYYHDFQIARINLILQGGQKNMIKLGNSLNNPAFEGQKFDYVICNPPFNVRASQEEISDMEKSDRFPYGIPSSRNKNYLFIQHILSSLKNTGKAAVIQPVSAVSHGGDESIIRSKLVDEDVIEAIIKLPYKLFYEVSIPAIILIINKQKENDRRNKIIFIDASNEYEEGRKQNHLKGRNIEKIVTTFKGFEEIEGFSRVVGIKEIAENSYDLNVYRYISYPREEKIDPILEVSKLRELEAERTTFAHDIDECLRALGIDI